MATRVTGNPSSAPAGPQRWLFVCGTNARRPQWVALAVMYACLGAVLVAYWQSLVFTSTPRSRGFQVAVTGQALVNTIACLWASVFLFRARAMIVRDHVDLWTLRQRRRVARAGAWVVTGLIALATLLAFAVPWVVGETVLNPVLLLQLPAMFFAWAVGGLPFDVVRKLEQQVARAVRPGWGQPPLI